MKKIISVALTLACICSFAGLAAADQNPAEFGPERIRLTLPQEKLLFESVNAGLDRLVMPLTLEQQDWLEQAWPGWRGMVLTIYPTDMVDGDGSIYVVPDRE